jgi:hypothetical protein
MIKKMKNIFEIWFSVIPPRKVSGMYGSQRRQNKETVLRVRNIRLLYMYKTRQPSFQMLHQFLSKKFKHI